MSTSYKAKDYWDSFYASRSAGRIPSQFAAFVLSEFHHFERIVEFGCGDGRDTFFFARSGKRVLGVDGSTSAVETCRSYASQDPSLDTSFFELDFSASEACDAFVRDHDKEWGGALIYARFFVHAITEPAQENFLRVCENMIGSDGALCIEFRTNRDEMQKKVTDAHFRRFVSPMEIVNAAGSNNMKMDYFCEGFGMAKYKNDDAHVARMIFSKRC